jgi:endogenous inhibitor of DNA gyrase (YacG/DUF329 family)
MRTKPVRRDEVRYSYPGFTAFPIDSMRKHDKWRYLVPVAKLWRPLLRQLDEEEKKLWEHYAQIGMPISRERTPVRAPDLIYPETKFACRQCGRRFYRLQAMGVYCSDKCVAEARRAAMAPVVKARSKARAAARANRKCKTCGKPIKAKRSTMRFCSVRCRVADHRNANG